MKNLTSYHNGINQSKNYIIHDINLIHIITLNYINKSQISAKLLNINHLLQKNNNIEAFHFIQRQKNIHKMLKPKSQIFKLKFHLAKVEAINNKVNSRVHAYLHIDNQQLKFKGAPQLKKNVAIFGSDLQYENYMIGFDQITGLYEQKKVLLVIEFQTQGAYIKVGQVNINVGQILNQKKYRVVNVYPLSKCYDKSAKAKIAVDFIPISQRRQENMTSKKTQRQVNIKTSSLTAPRRQQIVSSNVGGISNVGSNGFYKNPTGAIKSRLAQQQNVILQERVYEYQKRMDNYRIAQNELSERMQEQLERKDDKISELSLQLTKQQNTIHLITLENETYKTQIQALNQQLQLQKLQIKSHLATIESLQKSIQAKQKQIQSKNMSLQNLTRTKQNKQKYLTLEIQKYTNRYSQSEQQRNKIIFELENKLKLQLERKDQHYQQLINLNQGKYLQNLKSVKQRNKYLENHSKQLQDLSQEHDNKIKSLSLQLQKTIKLKQQQEEQMVYLNQQLGKVKKQRQSLTNELDSINFSYQQASSQLISQKDLVKQLIKKIEILKTELSLSNQTVEQQRQRIIVMSKDIQVHQERQYYMKEHYEQEIYDRQLSQNNVRGQKEELQLQLRKHKEQLKLSEQKHEEEHTKNQLLKSTVQSLEKQLSSKNSHLMKLGQEKIYLQTEVKNQKQLISQLQQQLTKLQQQKAMLSQALMQKKLALQNDKSLQWTYKIQSLQNDIQLMVEKFKSQKQQLKDTHRKQEIKKIQQINRLSQMNKKLKEDVEQLRQKFSKREAHIMSLEKSLKGQKQKYLEIDRQFSMLKQSYRLVSSDKQIQQQNLKQLLKLKQTRQKQIEQIQKKSQKYRKELTTIKNGFNRLISLILEYMVKRYNERANFQDISSNTVDLVVDGQIIGYVNVALKKFCDDHNKTRQMIKQLEQYKRSTLLSNGQLPSSGKGNRVNKFSQKTKFQRNFDQQQDYQNQKYSDYDYEARLNIKRNNHQFNHNADETNYYYNKRTFINNRGQVRSISPHNKFSGQNMQSFYSNDPLKQLQSYRFELDRMKKQQSEYKVKTKSLQQEIQKHQRRLDNQKFQKSRIKNQLQQAQDQITRINFTLRKKDKMIKQLQMQIQDVQKQNFQLKANPTYVHQKAKQKMAMSLPIQQTNSLPVIKDLESKLNLKTQQLLHTQKQVESLREQYLLELNEIKKLELKLKEKNNRIVNLEKQVEANSLKRNDDKDKEIMKLKKQLEIVNEQKLGLEDRIRQCENVIKEYELQVHNLQNRNKQLQQQLKFSQIQIKRNIQSNQFKINDKSTYYQTQILQYKSQLSQQKDKCQQLVQKNSHLNVSLAKKVKQLQICRQKLQSKQKQILMINQQFQQYKNKMTLRNNDLHDKIRELEMNMEGKSFELEECRFAYQGRVLELQRQIDDFRQGLLAHGGNNSAR